MNRKMGRCRVGLRHAVLLNNVADMTTTASQIAVRTGLPDNGRTIFFSLRFLRIAACVFRLA